MENCCNGCLIALEVVLCVFLNVFLEFPSGLVIHSKGHLMLFMRWLYPGDERCGGLSHSPRQGQVSASLCARRHGDMGGWQSWQGLLARLHPQPPNSCQEQG